MRLRHKARRAHSGVFGKTLENGVHAVEGDEGCGCGGDDEAKDPKGEEIEDMTKGRGCDENEGDREEHAKGDEDQKGG